MLELLNALELPQSNLGKLRAECKVSNPAGSEASLPQQSPSSLAARSFSGVAD
jgi:hypothetical protein